MHPQAASIWTTAVRAAEEGSTTSTRTPRSCTSGSRGAAAAIGPFSNARSNQNVLPFKGSLRTPTTPPMSCTSSCEIASPSPLPPKRRAVEASACT